MLEYETKYPKRVFLFKGSKVVACAEASSKVPPPTKSPPTKPPPTKPPATKPPATKPPSTVKAKDTTCVGLHCAEDQDHVCSEGVELDFSQVSTNNLGGMGPKTGAQTIQWKRVAKINGKYIDIIAKSSDTNYRTVNMKDRAYGRATIKKFNGVYSPGVGSIGSAQAGTFKITFTLVDTASQKPVTAKYLPLTFYDVDGGKEILETCDADSWVLRTPSAMTATSHGKCFRHKAGQAEVDLPKNWNNLEVKQKRAAVTYIFKNKSSFQISYTTKYRHRVFLFKGSKDVACSKSSQNRRRFWSGRRRK